MLQRVHDDENIAVQEHINSQLVISPLDETVTFRNRNGETDLEPTTSNTQTESEVKPAEPTNKPSLNLTKLLKTTLGHMEQLRYKLQRDTYKKCKNNEWLLVGILMDKICFLIYCSIIIISTMSIFKS